MYTQYLNVATMRIEKEEDEERYRSETIKFNNAMRCLGDQYIDKVVPDCVRILVNE